MNKIRSLAGQTVSYGISSILARVFNYALVPLHTSVFNEAQFGVIGYLYAWAAFMNILLTFGMETTYFRFATQKKDPSVYSTAFTLVSLFSLIVCGMVFLFRVDIATWMGYADQHYLVGWLAVIVFFDAILAIPFARLRLSNKVRQFVIARVGNIAIIVILNVLFLLAFPAIHHGDLLPSLIDVISPLYNDQLQVGYVFLANLVASISLVFFLWSELKAVRLKINPIFLRPMLLYTLPILLTGFAGTLNDQLDKILIRNFMSDADLGVYSAAFKLSIFMVLATQAFRYAGEPFFFSQAEDREAPALFARVMYYFIIASVVIYVGVCLNMDLLAFIFIRDDAMRAAVYLVPLLLLGKLFFGVYVNLSIWFKITDRTQYGTYFAVAGAIVTVLINVTLIPVIGFLASALACLACYLVMCLLAWYYGRKFFPIPYDLKSAFIYIISGVILVYASMQIRLENFWADTLFNLAASLIVVVAVILFEKKQWSTLRFGSDQ